MDDVKYEYGCEVTSTKECPLREEVRAEAIDEFAQKLIDYCIDYKPMYLNFLCVIEEVADKLKEQNK